jgi:hypothetical protein
MTRSHGRQRASFYGSLRYHKRGVQACRNGLQIRQTLLDQAVLDVLVRALEPEVLAEAVREAVAEMVAGQADLATRTNTIATELAQIATRERRLLDALVDGDGTAEVIRGRLRDELARRDALGLELASLEEATAPIDADALVRDISTRAADLRGAIRRNVPQASGVANPARR